MAAVRYNDQDVCRQKMDKSRQDAHHSWIVLSLQMNHLGL